MIKKCDIDDLVELLFNDKRIYPEIFDEIYRYKLAEYFQSQVLKRIKNENPECQIKEFDITIRIMNLNNDNKEKKRLKIGTGGMLFGSHKFCNYRSDDLPPFGFILIPLVNTETFNSKIAIFPMGSDPRLQITDYFNMNNSKNKTQFLTNSLFCNTFYITLVKTHN